MRTNSLFVNGGMCKNPALRQTTGHQRRKRSSTSSANSTATWSLTIVNMQYCIVYENWFFCKRRTQQDPLLISRSFGTREMSPLVLQAIKTMFALSGDALSEASIHSESASNSPDTKEPKPTPGAGPPPRSGHPPSSSLPPSSGGSQVSSNLGGQGSQTNASSNAKNLATLDQQLLAEQVEQVKSLMGLT
jgi:hypothetical protein